MKVPPFLGEADRYKVEREIARGGMGVVYRAYDKNLEQQVAIKIMLDGSNPEAKQLFDKEWRILRDLQDPRIIAITDQGEFSDGNTKFPFFVMPFLKGKTLHQCIHGEGEPLTVERIVQIICEAAGSLHAAHSKNVIHRDVKPSNIFVLESGAVVMIDFGVVHLAGIRHGTTVKGTPPYMSPELLAPIKKAPAYDRSGGTAQENRHDPDPRSDLFSLGIVCYEALTGQNPFMRSTPNETRDAILEHMPKPVYEMNARVGLLLSQVVQKSLAKDKTHRFASVKEFADKLQRALRGEPIPEFNPQNIDKRLQVVRDAMAKGQTTSANELLRSIEEDGLISPAIITERQKIDNTLERNWIREQIESARLYRQAKQYVEALEKLNEVLRRKPDHVQALAEKDSLDEERINLYLEEVREFIQIRRFADARRSIQEAINIQSRDPRAAELLAEVNRMEEEERQFSARKEALYQEAQSANRDGHLTTTLRKLEQLMEMIAQWGPCSNTERDAIYRSFYDVIAAEHGRVEEAAEEIRVNLAAGKIAEALEMCDQMLRTYPDYPLFLSLKMDAEDKERTARMEYVQRVRASVDKFVDLDVLVTTLQEAVNRYPTESQLSELLISARRKRDLVNNLRTKAQRAEAAGRYLEALEHWQTIRNCHSLYNGLDDEIRRVQQLLDDQLGKAKKARIVQEVTILLRAGDYQAAVEQCSSALIEFPDDGNLRSLHDQAKEKALCAPEVQRLITEGRKFLREGQSEQALEIFRKVVELDQENRQVRPFLGAALLDRAKAVLANNDWHTTEQLIQEARTYVPEHPDIKELVIQIGEKRRDEAVEETVNAAAALADQGDRSAAIAKLDAALKLYPDEPRLGSARSELRQKPAPELVEQEQFVDAGVATETDSIFSDNSVFSSSQPSNSSNEAATVPAVSNVDSSKDSSWFNKARAALIQQWELLRKKFDHRLPEVETETADRFQSYRKPALAAVLVLALVVIVWVGTRQPPPPPPPPTSPVNFDIATLPEGASISIDGGAGQVSRAHGSVQPGKQVVVSASLKGYERAEKAFTIDADGQRLTIELKPMPMELRVIGEAPASEVSLDGAVKGTTASPEGLLISGIAPGVHTLKISAGPKQIETSFDFRAAQAPSLVGLPGTASPTMLFLGSFDGQSGAECNCNSSLVVGDSMQKLGTARVQMSVAAGPHSAELTLSGVKKTVAFETGSHPSATVAVFWGSQRAPETITSRLDKAEEFINNLQLDRAELIVNQVLSEIPQNDRALALKGRIDRLRR